MTNRGHERRRPARLASWAGARALLACVAGLGLALTVPLLPGCGKEEKEEAPAPPPPPPPPPPEPERGEPVDLESLHQEMDVDARVRVQGDASKASPADESLARAMLRFAEAFARLGDDPTGSGLESMLDAQGQQILESIRNDLYGLEVEQVRLVMVDPSARTLTSPSSATVVLAFQIAGLPSEERSNVLVFQARKSGGRWTFAPSPATTETRSRASAWDGVGSLSAFRGEAPDFGTGLTEEDAGEGVGGPEDPESEQPEGEGQGGRQKDTPSGPVNIPGAPAGG